MAALWRYSWTLLVLSVFVVSCRSEPVRMHRYAGGALGTSYSILAYASEDFDIHPDIDSVFAVVNRSMSTYIPDSDISRINEGDTAVVVDLMFREVFELSGRLFEETDGYFDPTVGILVDAWGFGPGTIQELDSTKVDSLLHFVGLEKVALGTDGRIRKTSPEIRIDFNAIAKGYAIDRLAVMLDEQGIEDYLVEVGGEVVTKGINKDKQKEWTVGIDDPQVEFGRRIKLAIRLKDRALASSGNYRKFRIDSVTGEKYVHTIDPKTGYTKNSYVLSATVLAPTCAEADAYATSFMAMPLAASKVLIQEQEALEVYLIYLDEEGELKEYRTPGFDSLVVR